MECTTCHSASGWIGKETIHATDPAATVACTTCHETPHYEDLGTCDSCHGSHAGTHHGTATLADTQLTLVAAPATDQGPREGHSQGHVCGPPARRWPRSAS